MGHVQRYRVAIGEAPPEGEEPDADADDDDDVRRQPEDKLEGEEDPSASEQWQKRRMMGRVLKAQEESPLAPNVQGALLLQSLLRLPDPHYNVVLSRCGPRSRAIEPRCPR